MVESRREMAARGEAGLGGGSALDAEEGVGDPGLGEPEGESIDGGVVLASD